MVWISASIYLGLASITQRQYRAEVSTVRKHLMLVMAYIFPSSENAPGWVNELTGLVAQS